MITLAPSTPHEAWFPKLPELIARGVRIGFLEAEHEKNFQRRYSRIEKTLSDAKQAVEAASEAIASHDRTVAELVAREQAVRESLLQAEIEAKQRVLELAADAEQFAASFVKIMRDGESIP